MTKNVTKDVEDVDVVEDVEVVEVNEINEINDTHIEPTEENKDENKEENKEENEESPQAKRLKELEAELITIAKQDTKTWVSFYKLMEEVKNERLYMGTASSFTAWVKNLAQKCGQHESNLWNKLKAGRVYARYQETLAKRGMKSKPIEEIDVAVDSLVLLDKISRKDDVAGAELVDKVLNKTLSRADLRDTYKLLRAKHRSFKDGRFEVSTGEFKSNNDNDNPRKEYINTSVALSSNTCTESFNIDGPDSSDSPNNPKYNEDSVDGYITAPSIVKALSVPDWFGDVSYESSRRFAYSDCCNKYHTFTEFSVQTGTSKKSRRIDLLVAENVTMEDWGLTLHGIEIKVSKYDLISDTKYTEYGQSVDYLWLAIPLHLLKYATETKADYVGIIVIDQDGKARIEVQASKLQPLDRENTLTNIILKTIH